QIAALLFHGNHNVRKAIWLMLGTACRPSSAFEYDWAGTDFDAELMDLNPPGREQTAKYRPIVKMPPTLKTYLMQFNYREGVMIQRANRPIRLWETAWRNARKLAGLGKGCNPYSIRHTVARWLRAAGVPKWEIENQMGHNMLSTTDIYAPHEPEYLAHACAAIERLM